MDEQIQTLQYRPVMSVRMLVRDGEPWWVLADVCRALELSNPSKVAARLDDDEKQKIRFSPNSELGLNRNVTTIINESGLYTVILRSDKPDAKIFKRWITHEVLPSIRKNGEYRLATLNAESNAIIDTANTSQLKSTSRMLLYILRRLSSDGAVQIANSTLQELMNVRSTQTLRAARKTLIQMGHIEYTAGIKGNPGRYRIL